MIEIVLIRHGQPDWEPGGRAVDHPGLTSLGRKQAECAAAALAGERFDALYTSPLRRAQETAAPIAERLGLAPTVESWLEELRLPPLEGLTSAEVQRFFAQAHARDLEKWWDGMSGGESFRHFYGRVVAGVEAWLDDAHGAAIHEDSGQRIWRSDDRDRRLVIVAHEGTNAVLISHLLGIDPVPWAWLRFSSAWAGISRIATAPVAGGAVWVLRAFNRIEHLTGLATDLEAPGARPELALNPMP